MTSVKLLALITILPFKCEAHSAAHVKRVGGFLQLALHQTAVSPSGTDQVISALDTDHSGMVERHEIESFAKKTGIDSAQALKEFSDLDKDGDGKLNSNEVGNTLDEKPEAAVTWKAEPPAQLPSSQKTEPQQLLETAAVIVQQQAGRMLAESFAQQAAAALQRRNDADQKAARLEESARKMRAQASSLAAKADKQTLAAAKEAAAAVINKEQPKVKEMETKASQAEEAAHKKREQARQAMQSVMLAQANILKSVKELHDKGSTGSE